MKTRTGALLIPLLAGGCWGLEAAATAPAEVLGEPVLSTNPEEVKGIIEKSFWRYFNDDSIHDFMAPGGADEARAFTIPPWGQEP